MSQIHSWTPGDRVYSVSHPELTGTVKVATMWWAEVDWDNGHWARVVPFESLEWFTRPKETGVTFGRTKQADELEMPGPSPLVESGTTPGWKPGGRRFKSGKVSGAAREAARQ